MRDARQASPSITRALAVAPLNPGDLIAGRTALTQAATWAPTRSVVSHIE